MAAMCGAAKLLPVARIDPPPGQATSTSMPRAKNSTGGVGHPDTVELAVWSECPDDSSACSSMPADVPQLVGHDTDLLVLSELDADGACDRGDERMVTVDAAVEDADLDPSARRSLERPLAGRLV